MKNKKIEEYKVIAISSCHITLVDVHVLDNFSKDNHMILKRDTGWFIKLFEELEYNLKPGFSSYLKKIITFANENGYRMIEIDANAREYPKLFVRFDW